MKLLLLGISESALPTLQQLVEADQFQIVGWFDSEACHSQLRELFPSGRLIRDQEDFERAAANTLVVAANGGDLAQRETALRNMARDSVPLLLIQPACSAIFAAELDMIQRDTGAPMIPLHLDSLHPSIRFLSHVTRTWDQSSPIGKLEQIVMERAAQERSDDTVRAFLAKDALLLRRLIGNFEQVSGLKAGSDKSLANLSIHLTGQCPAMTKWSVGPVIDTEGATISLIGNEGRISLAMPTEGEWSLSTTAEPNDFLNDVPTTHDAIAALGEQIQSGLDSSPVTPTWEDAYRAIDLADNASESVRRGKTLRISNAQLTEEDTFKSMMAAGGCLIILILPFLLLLISLVDGLQIPYSKTVSVVATANDRSLDLPADYSSLEKVSLASGTELTLLTNTELYDRFGLHQKGEPQAFSANRNEITLAPIPEEACEVLISYEGSYNMWKGWPLILLLPIAFFLMLQLLKFVFPKKPATST